MIWEQGAIDVILPKSNRKMPKDFDAELYKQRNKIEFFFDRLKASTRRSATQENLTQLHGNGKTGIRQAVDRVS